MKRMTKAILFSSIILAAQAASADGTGFPGAVDDAGVTLAPRVTYMNEHGAAGQASTESAFASRAPDGVFLPANVTYASEHASDSVAVAAAFPGETDDAGVHLIARTTHADTHLDRSMQAQGTDNGAN